MKKENKGREWKERWEAEKRNRNMCVGRWVTIGNHSKGARNVIAKLQHLTRPFSLHRGFSSLVKRKKKKKSMIGRTFLQISVCFSVANFRRPKHYYVKFHTSNSFACNSEGYRTFTYCTHLIQYYVIIWNFCYKSFLWNRRSQSSNINSSSSSSEQGQT